MIVLVTVGIMISGLSGGGQPSAGSSAAGYHGPFAPVTLNADNSVTMGQPRISGPVLDVYEDFGCSACQLFEQTYGATIERLAYLGKVKVVYHLFTVSSVQPQQASSVRSWSAARCAPPARWIRYHDALFGRQSGPVAAGGKTMHVLVRLGRKVGITAGSFVTCVTSQKYAALNAPVSDEILNSGLSNLPVLRLNGQTISPGATPDDLRRLIVSTSAGGQPVTAAAYRRSGRTSAG